MFRQTEKFRQAEEKFKAEKMADQKKYLHLEQKFRMIESNLEHQSKLTDVCLKRCASGSELVNLITPSVERQVAIISSEIKAEIRAHKFILGSFNETIIKAEENCENGLRK